MDKKTDVSILTWILVAFCIINIFFLVTGKLGFDAKGLGHNHGGLHLHLPCTVFSIKTTPCLRLPKTCSWEWPWDIGSLSHGLIS